MSGGVDSAAAALLLLRAGYSVAGVFLRLWGEGDLSGAESVCKSLGIPLAVVDGRELFGREVIEPFVREYLSGRTPNPCVGCNRHVKLPLLLRYMELTGADLAATGHYARRGEENGATLLMRASYLPKDQSYALCMVKREITQRLLLPLGELSKAEVRALVREAGLPLANKAESQDICFVPGGDYSAFVEGFCGDLKPMGRFKLESGEDLGPHRGLWRYTVGQRRGLGVALGYPVFVRRIDVSSGDVFLSADSALYSRSLVTDPLNWLDRDRLTGPERFTVKQRYGAKPAWALVTPLKNGGALVEFDSPQRAITPGQSAALYNGEILCGGGAIIECCD
jgi:tRNA-specific 2-thiouridylase